MGKSARKKPSAAQQALYAPKPKTPPPRPRPSAVEKHTVSDEALRKIIQRVLSELKVPGTIPSEVIFTALAEVRALVEATLTPRP